MTPQELKHGSPRTNFNTTPDIDELAAKDLLDDDWVEALNALNKYQATTKSWREKAIIPKEFEEGTSSSSGQQKQNSRANLNQSGKDPSLSRRRRLRTHIDLQVKQYSPEHSLNIVNLRKYYMYDNTLAGTSCPCKDILYTSLLGTCSFLRSGRGF